MRPKKIILCVNTDPDELSVLTYLLHIRGYSALPAQDWIEAKLLFGECAVDLVLVDGAVDVSLCAILKAQKPHIPIVLIGTPSQVGKENSADSVLVSPTPTELIEMVKIMSSRRRGPKVGSHRKPPVSVTVAAAMERVG